jgi:Ca2+-binding RTX toxin-like protein
VVIEGAAEGSADTVQSRVNNYVLADNVENLVLLGVAGGYGNAGNNVITGSLGNNLLGGMGGADTIDGKVGVDTAIYAMSSAGVDVSLATGRGRGGDAEGDKLIGIENLIGSTFNDTLEGDSGNNTLIGAGGNDTVSYQNAVAGVVLSLVMAGAQNTIGAGIDKLSGFSNVTGSAFADNLTGNQLANRLVGGSGNDVLNGGAGTDTLEGGSGADRFVFGTNFGKDTIADFEVGVDRIQIAKSVFPQSLNLAAAISDDGLGNARLTLDAANSVTFLGVSAAQLKQFPGDFEVS